MGVLSDAYRLEFDAASLRRFAALANSAAVFGRYYTTAMNASVNMVRTQAKARAPVGDYSVLRVVNNKARYVSTGRTGGTLRRGITGLVRGPWEGYVGVGEEVPYARRRELGFDQQTDALGRYYAMDPADPTKRANMFYLKRGLQASEPFISSAFATSTRMALREMFI